MAGAFQAERALHNARAAMRVINTISAVQNKSVAGRATVSEFDTVDQYENPVHYTSQI